MRFGLRQRCEGATPCKPALPGREPQRKAAYLTDGRGRVGWCQPKVEMSAFSPNRNVPLELS